MNKNIRNAYELYFKRDGQRVSVLCNTPREVGERRRQLKRNKRKFLGFRPVKLAEI